MGGGVITSFYGEKSYQREYIENIKFKNEIPSNKLNKFLNNKKKIEWSREKSPGNNFLSNSKNPFFLFQHVSLFCSINSINFTKIMEILFTQMETFNLDYSSNLLSAYFLPSYLLSTFDSSKYLNMSRLNLSPTIFSKKVKMN